MTQTVEEFIEHVGVKGMHWGVRKARGTGKPSGDFKKASELRKKQRHQLTNKQLKIINERMNLEQNFSRMNPTTLQRGANTAKTILAVGTSAATAYTLFNSPAGKAAIASGKKLLAKIKHSHMEVGVDFIKQRNSLLLRTVS